MADSLLDHVLRHNTWATRSLIDFCKTLDAARLDANAGGTYGSLYGTLQHLVGAEQWYTQLLTGEVLGQPIRRTDAPHSLDELATIAAATGARLLAAAGSDDAGRVVVTNERRSTVGVVLTQVVHHANEHRTQATTILGANGIEPPPLSAWAYGRAMKISTTEE